MALYGNRLEGWRTVILIAQRAVLAGLGLWLAFPAWACRYDPDRLDKRPLAERLEEMPVAFIGTVSGVTADGMVEFQIEHLLHGDINGQRFTVKSGRSSCDLRFSAGERWIYGGATLFHPSVLLVTSEGRASLSFVRMDDSRLAFPTEWQTCSSDAACRVLRYGCTATAVNEGFLSVAKENAWRIGGDPSALDCELKPPASAFSRVLCEQKKCGIWTLQTGR